MSERRNHLKNGDKYPRIKIYEINLPRSLYFCNKADTVRK